MGLACMYVYAEVYLEPSRISTMGHLCENHKKSFMLDVRLGSKYASDISSTVEKVYKCQCLWNIDSQFCQSKKFVIDFLVT